MAASKIIGEFMTNPDPHVVLEQLHADWEVAAEATQAAWEKLRREPGNDALLDRYYALQSASNEACQAILAHKEKFGI